MILLADANMLIDLGNVGGLKLLPQIEETEVLDLVLQECEDDRNPKLIQEIQECGISTVEAKTTWTQDILNIQAESNNSLSFPDSANIHYAQTNQRLLITGDKPLRNMCAKKQVNFHGSIWLVEQAFKNEYIAIEELCRWLDVWPRTGSRLPIKELTRLKAELNC